MDTSGDESTDESANKPPDSGRRELIVRSSVGKPSELTYKSSDDWVVLNPAPQSLVLWPGEDGKEVKRTLYVSKEILDLIRSERPPAGFAKIPLIRFLNKFVAGLAINVSSDPDNPYAELKPLRDGDGVWSLKIQKPRPGWRYLGYFARKDVLVLLTARDRVDLADDWSEAIGECQQYWAHALSARSPTRSNIIRQCLSEPYYEP